jgi:cytochrome c556
MRVALFTAVGAIALTSAIVAAKPLTKGQALAVMHERHEGMEDIGKNNKVLRRELTATTPDLAAVRSAAAVIAKHSSQAAHWFPLGTGPNVGNTGARLEIWQKPQDFAAKLRNFQSAARALDAAAKSGNLVAIKARYADIGGTCKACHDSYRSEMKH